jgi:tetratricopeptide (TPR) repeat protein
MRYDKDGFPIPPDFDFRTDDSSEAGFPGAAASGGARQPSPARPSGGGSRKRMLLVAFVAAGLVPAIVGPELMPTIRRAVVEWSLERAAEREARSDVAGAVGDVSRALHWHGDDAELLCMRAMLRLENRDAAGALGDAERAAAMAPTAIQPLRVRALIHVVNANADAALADAGMVVELASRGDPDALNHRAYIRALVGRELPAALADIEAAIASAGEASAELLDTRGYILHLLDRQQEAIDQLNLAIDSMQQSRRQLALLAGRIDPVELARRQRALDHGLAVMFHHRGLACRAIGLEQQARQDLEIAGRKGFDPSRGIF